MCTMHNGDMHCDAYVHISRIPSVHFNQIEPHKRENCDISDSVPGNIKPISKN
jgi:hypothetical protein